MMKYECQQKGHYNFVVEQGRVRRGRIGKVERSVVRSRREHSCKPHRIASWKAEERRAGLGRAGRGSIS